MANYGTDLAGYLDLTPTMAETSGNRLLAEACARRLITPRGGLIDDPNYGYDVTELINDDLGPRDLAILSSGIQQELLKDERVIAVEALVTLGAGGNLVITVNLTGANGPFLLVLGVSSVLVLGVSSATVTILQVAP